jgi:type II secretory pathway component PulM
LEARSIKTWREYLERIREILQSIEECAQEVKQIQTSILVRVFSNAGVDD